MRFLVLIVMGLLIQVGICPGGTDAQAAPPLCSPCGSIQFDHLLTLNGAKDAWVGATASVDRNSQGLWFVRTASEPYSILILNPDGTLKQRLGRRGEGPGEFMDIPWFKLHRDTLHVLDEVLYRWTIFDEELNLVATHPFPRGRLYGLDVNSGTQLLLTQDTRAPLSAAGYPLHVVDSSGTLIRSFGAERPVVRMDQPEAHTRVSAPHRPGHVWTARRHGFVVEQWGLDGTLVRRITRAVDWWVPGQKMADPAAPIEQIVRLFEDSGGRVWLLIAAADPRWKEAVSTGPYNPIARQRSHPVIDRDQYFDTVIEVLDGSDGQTLARERYDHAPHWFTNFGAVQRYREDASGTPYVDIWMPRLVSPAATGRR